MVSDPVRFLKWLEWELAWREHVLALTVSGGTRGLSPIGRVWFEYMRAHARAQMARYANEIDEREFVVVCRGLRESRDNRFKALSRKKVS